MEKDASSSIASISVVVSCLVRNRYVTVCRNKSYAKRMHKLYKCAGMRVVNTEKTTSNNKNAANPNTLVSTTAYHVSNHLQDQKSCGLYEPSATNHHDFVVPSTFSATPYDSLIYHCMKILKPLQPFDEAFGAKQISLMVVHPHQRQSGPSTRFMTTPWKRCVGHHHSYHTVCHSTLPPHNQQYAQEPIEQLTLRQMLDFGRDVTYKQDKILTSARYVHREVWCILYERGCVYPST